MQDLLKKATDSGEVPVVAAIVKDNAIISYGLNQMEGARNACMHAEIMAINEACTKLQSKYLDECDIYVTLEPCTMCAAAISLAKIKRLYFGAYDVKGGGVINGVRVYNSNTCHHVPEVYAGIMEYECATLLKNFFANKRSSASDNF